jgi:hypothetical protein
VSNTTIKNCYFFNGNSDGVQSGASNLTVTDNEFRSINPHGNAALHTDCFQLLGCTDSIFRRNYFIDFEQALAAFDGTNGNTVEDNVFYGPPYSPAHWLSMMADNPGSTLNHNTLFSNGQIYLSSKTGGAPSTSFVSNNICAGIGLSGSGVTGTPQLNVNNNRTSSVVTFVGGANPTTWQGFKLTSGSVGHNEGNDGLDVGIRAS